MHEAVDGGHGHHGILEDLVPLAEDEVGGDEDALLLVALGEEGEKDLHLLAGLLGVAEVVDCDGVETLEPGDQPLEFEVAFGDEELGYDAVGGRVEDRHLMLLDELAAECGQE